MRADNQRLRALYGLKYNPFRRRIPTEDLWHHPGLGSFAFRVESLVLDGGFALLTGDPGLGKSKALQILADRLDQIGDVHVRVMERPQSLLGDFYRELGRLFGVNLSPANRYGGFQALRGRWLEHIKSSLFRPVLLIDEAQQIPTACLDELRIMSSARFDSECLLTTVLCGDGRLPDRLRERSLVPLGTRIRARMVLEPLGRDAMAELLTHLLERAGAPHLCTEGLQDALVDHATGSPRMLAAMADELLVVGLEREASCLDEGLFLDVFGRSVAPRTKKKKRS